MQAIAYGKRMIAIFWDAGRLARRRSPADAIGLAPSLEAQTVEIRARKVEP